MHPNVLTQDWLNPILLAVIGFSVVYYLKSMNDKMREFKDTMKEIDVKFSKHIEKIETSLDTVSERHYKIDTRITRLEDRIIAK